MRTLPHPRRSAHRSLLLAERAREMRRSPTGSEARLFEAVRGRRLGVAFRRQVPVAGRYIADLFVPELRLIVEIDGGYHTRRTTADARRDRALSRGGYRVVRIDAELVLPDLEAAVRELRKEIEAVRRR